MIHSFMDDWPVLLFLGIPVIIAVTMMELQARREMRRAGSVEAGPKSREEASEGKIHSEAS